MNYLIKNGRILTESSSGGFSVIDADVLIKDGIIEKIGSDIEEDGCETVDASCKLVMPGLINSHTHAYMSLLRSYADDVPFNEWLFDRIMPVEDSMEREDAYWSSLLGIAEMIKTGTTCFVDMHMFRSQSAKAASDVGMRAFIGRGLVGEDLYIDGSSRFVDAITEKQEYESDLIKFVLAPHALYSCSDHLLAQVNEEARKLGMRKQIHLCESDFEVENARERFGKTPVELLSDVGFLDENTLLSHCVKLTDRDIEILAKSKASVVTNPASNAKLGNGSARVVDMQRAGINVCLGTDSVASNNTLNMFREMGLVTLLHKAKSCDPTTLSSTEVLRMATTNSAKALGMQGKAGTLKAGAFADLIFVDLKSTSLFPNNNIVSSLCYSANGSEVSSVMINGKFVMKDRELTTIDLEKVYFEVERIVKKYLKK